MVWRPESSAQPLKQIKAFISYALALREELSTQRLQFSSFLVMTAFLVRDYIIDWPRRNYIRGFGYILGTLPKRQRFGMQLPKPTGFRPRSNHRQVMPTKTEPAFTTPSRYAWPCGCFCKLAVILKYYLGSVGGADHCWKLPCCCGPQVVAPLWELCFATRHGCFYNLGVHFLGVLVMGSLAFWCLH